MNKKDPKLTALLFNECINTHNLERLIDLMAENHKFINTKNREEDKEQRIKSWKEFFEDYPDYVNIFHKVISKEENFIILLGRSECSHKPLNGPAIWTAKVENDLITEWRIFYDTQDNREKLGIQYISDE